MIWVRQTYGMNFPDDERKQAQARLLNRYVSSVSGNREKQELAISQTNEYYNKNYMEALHPKLQWQLLCQPATQVKLNIILG